MSDSNTGRLILKVHIWDIMFARENTCRVFENQVCQWLGIRIGRILERLSIQSNQQTKKKQVRKFVFIKLLAGKVRLCFFKNTVQLQLSTKYKTKISFVSSGT